MSKKNTVTAEMIEKIIKDGEFEVCTIGNKTTLVAFTTKEGFVITESSSCVDPANYDIEMGKDICISHIKNKLWELEGYRLQREVSKAETSKLRAGEVVVSVTTEGMDEAISKARELGEMYKNLDVLQQRLIKDGSKLFRFI